MCNLLKQQLITETDRELEIVTFGKLMANGIVLNGRALDRTQMDRHTGTTKRIIFSASWSIKSK